MKTAELVIVSDKGALRVYQSQKTAKCALMLVELSEFAAGQAKYHEKVTDRSRAFPWGGGGNSTPERMSVEGEERARVFRSLGKAIESFLQKYQPESWDFAAPPEINGRILENVDSPYKERLRRNVKKDLVMLAPSQVLTHFQDAA